MACWSSFWLLCLRLKWWSHRSKILASLNSSALREQIAKVKTQKDSASLVFSQGFPKRRVWAECVFQHVRCVSYVLTAFSFNVIFAFRRFQRCAGLSNCYKWQPSRKCWVNKVGRTKVRLWTSGKFYPRISWSPHKFRSTYDASKKCAFSIVGVDPAQSWLTSTSDTSGFTGNAVGLLPRPLEINKAHNLPFWSSITLTISKGSVWYFPIQQGYYEGLAPLISGYTDIVAQSTFLLAPKVWRKPRLRNSQGLLSFQNLLLDVHHCVATSSDTGVLWCTQSHLFLFGNQGQGVWPVLFQNTAAR